MSNVSQETSPSQQSHVHAEVHIPLEALEKLEKRAKENATKEYQYDKLLQKYVARQ